MINIHVDGGTRYGGICLVDTHKNKTITKKRNGVQQPLTNNELEYLAVIYALEYAKNNYSRRTVVIISDSQLIVNHINGKYKCKVPNLMRLLEKVKKKMFDGVTVRWTPRDSNLAGCYLERFY